MTLCFFVSFSEYPCVVVLLLVKQNSLFYCLNLALIASSVSISEGE